MAVKLQELLKREGVKIKQGLEGLVRRAGNRQPPVLPRIVPKNVLKPNFNGPVRLKIQQLAQPIDVRGKNGRYVALHDRRVSEGGLGIYCLGFFTCLFGCLAMLTGK